MNLDKSNMKKIMLLVFFTLLMLWAMINYVVALRILGYAVGLLQPLILGFCIAFVVNVIMRAIEEKIFVFADRHTKNKVWKGVRRPLSMLLSFGIICGIIYFVFAMVIPEIKHTVEMLAVAVPQYINKCVVWISEFVRQNNIESVDVNAIIESLSSGYEEIKSTVFNAVKNIFSGSVGILGSAISATVSVFSGVFNAIMGVVFSIYILLTKETLCRQAKQIVYAFAPQKVADETVYVARLSNKMFSNFVTGQCVEAVIIGVLCFIGMSIFKMPYAPMISVLVGFSALIPVFGAFIGTAIGAFLILMINPLQAVWFVLFIIVLQQLEGNLIYPHVVGNSVGLPSIWVMFAVLVGGSINGIIGMLVAVPIVAIGYALLARATREKLKEKKINVEDK